VKLRSPVTPEQALARIAGVIGWDRAAEILDRGESALRKWSNPDSGPCPADHISLAKANELDDAYRAEGGEGRPFLQYMVLAAETRELETDACRDELARAAGITAKETGEAVAAVITAAQTGCLTDLTIAEREVEEAIAAGTHQLALIRQHKKSRK